jgi:hypothetical protein
VVIFVLFFPTRVQSDDVSGNKILFYNCKP